VNAETNLDEVPSGFVTVTSTAPAAWAGVTTEIAFDEIEVTDAPTPPKETVADGSIFDPVSVTAVLPAVGPDAGVIDVRVIPGV